MPAISQTYTPMAPSMRDSIDGRYVRLDVVRAFAIIMVVALHSVHEYMDESVYQAVHPYICTPVLFFMTSGALIFPVRSGRAFVRRRMWALLPAFAFWTVVYLLMDYYLTPHQDVSIGHRLLYCLYTPTWGTGWFVLAMVGLYLFAPFCRRGLPRPDAAASSIFCCCGLQPGRYHGSRPKPPYWTMEAVYSPVFTVAWAIWWPDTTLHDGPYSLVRAVGNCAFGRWYSLQPFR